MSDIGAFKYISHLKARSLCVRKLDKANYAQMVGSLRLDELLYALFDVSKSESELLAEGANQSTVSLSKTVFMRIDSQEEFDSNPWQYSGWIYFYAVPEWYTKDPLFV